MDKSIISKAIVDGCSPNLVHKIAPSLSGSCETFQNFLGKAEQAAQTAETQEIADQALQNYYEWIDVAESLADTAKNVATQCLQHSSQGASKDDLEAATREAYKDKEGFEYIEPILAIAVEIGHSLGEAIPEIDEGDEQYLEASDVVSEQLPEAVNALLLGPYADDSEARWR